MNNHFSIGGVPEHFNLPWHLAMEEGKFEEANIHLHWQDYPGGTGAMTADLRENKLDIALLLTEGAVADISKGSNYKIAGLYVKSPLIWGIHVYQQAPFKEVEELKGKRFAISRFGSGSHLMAFVNAQQQGWNPSDISFELVGNLEGAREAFAKGRADAFMWEKFMTKPLVDSGEWKRIGECPTPWPCFVLVVRDEIAQQQPEAIQKVINIIQERTVEAKEDSATIKMVAKRYHLKEEDAASWFQDVEWSNNSTIAKETLQKITDTLHQLQIIEQKRAPEELCNHFCQLV